MTTRNLAGIGSLLGAVLLSGCLGLDIENPNNPDRERALDNSDDVETLVASSWMAYWNRTQVQGWPYYILTANAGVHSTSVANSGALLMSELPRPIYDNNAVSEVSGLARFPWYEYYSDLDSANEALRALDAGMQFGPGGQDTHRGRTFATLSQGLLLGNIGLMYDQGFVADETTPAEELGALEPVPYPDVIEFAAGKLEAAAVLATQGSFEIPYVWMNNIVRNERDLARLAHSQIARLLVYSARSPEERNEVDWNRVLHHLDQGIVQDVTADHQSGDLGNSNFKRRISWDVFGGYRAWPGLVGKADVSGNYQDWLATPLQDRRRFQVTTPDRRITGATPDSDGKYYRYLTTNPFRDERGTWRQSHYQYYRWGGEWQNAELTIMTADEMNLLRAEAYLRTNRPQQAAELINLTRVGNGELPPVTADGVPQAADCVPRNDDGSCMDLMGALWWERMIEVTGMESPRDWADQRGFGMLEEGTFLHLPIPGRELETLGMSMYTFGGVGGQASAPAPTRPR
jgi:hypothetical protein